MMPFTGRPYVRKPLVWGRTAKMLQNDIKKRVQSVALIHGDMSCIIALNEDWLGPNGKKTGEFQSWEHARNWVRKSIQIVGPDDIPEAQNAGE